MTFKEGLRDSLGTKDSAHNSSLHRETYNQGVTPSPQGSSKGPDSKALRGSIVSDALKRVATDGVESLGSKKSPTVRDVPRSPKLVNVFEATLDIAN